MVLAIKWALESVKLTPLDDKNSEKLLAKLISNNRTSQLTYEAFIKDSAHYCYCTQFLHMSRQSRTTQKKWATRRTRRLVLSPASLGGSSYFLWKKCIVFQRMKNNFYLPCQFFENRRSMHILLFLPYDRSDQTFYSQTNVNSKTSKVIASRSYA